MIRKEEAFCEYCGAIFKTAKGRLVHLRNTHKNLPLPEEMGKIEK